MSCRFALTDDGTSRAAAAASKRATARRAALSESEARSLQGRIIAVSREESVIGFAFGRHLLAQGNTFLRRREILTALLPHKIYISPVYIFFAE